MSRFKNKLTIIGILFLISIFINIFTFEPIGEFKKGIDIAGGVQLDYLIDFSKYKTEYAGIEYNNQVNSAKEIIKQNLVKRANSLGVGDTQIYLETRGDDEYIVVKIGGVSDIEKAKATIGKTVELEFKLANTNTGIEANKIERINLAKQQIAILKQYPNVAESIGSGGQSQGIYYNPIIGPKELIYKNSNLDSKALDAILKLSTGTVYDEVVFANLIEQDFSGNNIKTPGYNVLQYLGSQMISVDQFKSQNIGYSGDIMSGISITKTKSGDMIKIYGIGRLFVLGYNPWTQAKASNGDMLNGGHFSSARAGQDNTGKPAVTISLNGHGKQIFCDITTNHVGQALGIFVGGQLVTNPKINEKICGGETIINGNFTSEQVKTMVSDLNEGALPAPLSLANEQKMSATLGANAWTGAIYATITGLILVFILMVYMYGVSYASIAMISLLVFLSILMAVLKIFGYALSLSGIAAILLNIGMGVDASVLIFERLREEKAKGKNILSAISTAYDRSRVAIRDGNLSTLAIGLLLAMMGSDVFQGFGIMMCLNILFLLTISVPLIKKLLELLHKQD